MAAPGTDGLRWSELTGAIRDYAVLCEGEGWTERARERWHGLVASLVQRLQGEQRPMKKDEVELAIRAAAIAFVDVGEHIDGPQPGVPDGTRTVKADRPTDAWADRALGMRCKTCVFFAPKGVAPAAHPQGGKALGRCRRHAPTMGGYPVVFEADWCGDHKLKEG